jgi:hypothetical protein
VASAEAASRLLQLEVIELKSTVSTLLQEIRHRALPLYNLPIEIASPLKRNLPVEIPTPREISPVKQRKFADLSARPLFGHAPAREFETLFEPGSNWTCSKLLRRSFELRIPMVAVAKGLLVLDLDLCVS